MKIELEVDLVDVAGGNLGSVGRCLKRLNVPYRLANAKNPPSGNRPIILPGVGNFGAVMNNLKRDGFDQLLIDLIAGGTPYLGICVGMQVLFDWGDESQVAGLGILAGKVVKLEQGKIPQIGWNQIVPRKGDGMPGYVYFVNSYVAQPRIAENIFYTADYHGQFCAAVQSKNITAFQFHPEKSGEFGEKLLCNWLDTVNQC